MSKRVPLVLAVGFILCAGTRELAAQANRIASAVDRRDTVALTGHVNPLAIAANERGRADASMPMPGITLFFRPTADQQKALEELLARQQDPSSTDYHNWLTPEQYADRFGLSAADMAKVKTWLEGEGFTVALAARGRNSITFNGTAGQVEKTFQTEIHRYLVESKLHYANATEPSIPLALGGLVGYIRGLHDFHPRAHASLRKPRFDNPPGLGGGYQIAPDDAAVIYDYKTLYNQGITGSGQNVVVVGQVQIDLTDISSFRSMFNLPASAPTLVPVPNLKLPPIGAIDSGDLGESDLDIETVGGVARGANVIFVYSDNVEDAITYAIDNANTIGPGSTPAWVLSSSYGLCEALTGLQGANSDRTLAQKAGLEGMTWLSASGDDGAVDCYGQVSGNGGLGVDEPGSIPEVTSVGGTEFNEAGSGYWASTNNVNDTSALQYIPEIAWNDDDGSDGSASASGGGASMYFTRPTWQAGTGTFSNDGMRDVPDVSFSASANHDGWLICTGGGGSGCTLDGLSVFGGTSVSAPLFSGMLVLLSHYLVLNGGKAGLGPINQQLYSLAASAPSAFHDVTTGDNMVDPCQGRSLSCKTPVGYSAGTGYDMATGWGSVDVAKFIAAWTGAVTMTKTTPTISLSAPQSILQTASTTLTATLTNPGSSTSPTGSVSFISGNVTLKTVTLSASGSKAAASLLVQGTALSPGSNTITAAYSGDTNFNSATTTTTVTVVVAGQTPSITSGAAVVSSASYQAGVTSNSWVTITGTNLSTVNDTWTNSIVNGVLPTVLDGVSVKIGGVAAFVYYVSANQINVLAPSIGSGPVQVTVTNASGTSAPVTVTALAQQPAFFQWGSYAVATRTDYSYAVKAGTFSGLTTTPAKPGDVLILWGTGFGATSPAAPSGVVTPANGTVYSTANAVTVTVGSVNATAYGAALTSGNAGLYQVAIQVPASLANGDYPVVATINGVQSPSTTLLTVQN